MGKKIDKKCESHCPNCGAGIDDIEWGRMESGATPNQSGTCEKCGCEFDERYEYQATTFTVGQVKRVPCTYPLSEFYTYMDEVVDGDRASTTEDCEKCNEEDCDIRHCLISGPLSLKKKVKRQETKNGQG